MSSSMPTSILELAHLWQSIAIYTIYMYLNRALCILWMSQYMFVSFCYYWFLNHVDEIFCTYNITSFNLLDMWSLEKFSLEMHQRSNHSNFCGYEECTYFRSLLTLIILPPTISSVSFFRFKL